MLATCHNHVAITSPQVFPLLRSALHRVTLSHHHHHSNDVSCSLSSHCSEDNSCSPITPVSWQPLHVHSCTIILKTQHELSWRGKTILQKRRRGKIKLPSKLMLLLEKSISKKEMSTPFITRIVSTRLESLGMVTFKLAFLPPIAINFPCPRCLT